MLVFYISAFGGPEEKDNIIRLSEKEAEEELLKILNTNQTPMSTSSIKAIMHKNGRRCADSLMRVLNKMRYKGLLDAELSSTEHEWLWWVIKE